ncbi:MAG: bifunctional ornithine acetyltransferase/N-acetylglutamate synthase [Candidatus Kapaibacterium sp.]
MIEAPSTEYRVPTIGTFAVSNGHSTSSGAEGAFHEIAGGVTAPKGFQAAGIYCGIRKVKKDIALITSEVPAEVAAVFTLNKTLAAPVIVDKLLVERSVGCSAIVVNSGNANACTGEQGMRDAWTMVHETASALNISDEEVLVSSTGVIGQYMPMENVVNGIRLLPSQLSANGSSDAAEAIMTTDTYAKEIAVEIRLPFKDDPNASPLLFKGGAGGGYETIRIGGIAKGSGMIQPNMATMLAFLTTDAKISRPLLQKTFAPLIDRSFNRISVDGDTSTNDMAVLLANGRSGAPEIQAGTKAFEMFSEALEFVLVRLAKMIARDGEGATKLVEILVKGARSEAEALQAARAVANSNLVKTAIHGSDANWGRILAAVGYSGIDFDPENVSLYFGELPILKPHYEIVIDEARAKELFSLENITITIDLHQGTESANFWTCDLSKDYVHINASYRT